MHSTQIDLLIGRAVEQAQRALDAGDYPVGAVLIVDDEIIVARNERNSRQDKNSHAEINAIKMASEKAAGQKTLFVTLEPCGMCAKALMKFGINRVFYILNDPVNGALKEMHGVSIKRIENLSYLRLMANWIESYREKYPAHYEYFKQNLLNQPGFHA